jgi:hypothetical protein
VRNGGRRAGGACECCSCVCLLVGGGRSRGILHASSSSSSSTFAPDLLPRPAQYLSAASHRPLRSRPSRLQFPFASSSRRPNLPPPSLPCLSPELPLPLRLREVKPSRTNLAAPATRSVTRPLAPSPSLLERARPSSPVPPWTRRVPAARPSARSLRTKTCRQRRAPPHPVLSCRRPARSDLLLLRRRRRRPVSSRHPRGREGAAAPASGQRRKHSYTRSAPPPPSPRTRRKSLASCWERTSSSQQSPVLRGP